MCRFKRRLDVLGDNSLAQRGGLFEPEARVIDVIDVIFEKQAVDTRRIVDLGHDIIRAVGIRFRQQVTSHLRRRH